MARLRPHSPESGRGLHVPSAGFQTPTPPPGRLGSLLGLEQVCCPLARTVLRLPGGGGGPRLCPMPRPPGGLGAGAPEPPQGRVLLGTPQPPARGHRRGWCCPAVRRRVCGSPDGLPFPPGATAGEAPPPAPRGALGQVRPEDSIDVPVTGVPRRPCAPARGPPRCRGERAGSAGDKQASPRPRSPAVG